MTKYLILILFILPLVVIAQPKLDTTRIQLKHNFKTPPAYFLDSVYIDISKTYIDIENIESIKVTKDTFFNSENIKFGNSSLNIWSNVSTSFTNSSWENISFL